MANDQSEPVITLTDPIRVAILVLIETEVVDGNPA